MNAYCNLRMPLSRRESEVLNLMAMGFANKEIARELEISVRTTEIFRARALGKLGARNGLHAVALAVSIGLVRVKLTKKLRAPDRHDDCRKNDDEAGSGNHINAADKVRIHHSFAS